MIRSLSGLMLGLSLIGAASAAGTVKYVVLVDLRQRLAHPLAGTTLIRNANLQQMIAETRDGKLMGSEVVATARPAGR